MANACANCNDKVCLHLSLFFTVLCSDWSITCCNFTQESSPYLLDTALGLQIDRRRSLPFLCFIGSFSGSALHMKQIIWEGNLGICVRLIVHRNRTVWTESWRLTTMWLRLGNHILRIETYLVEKGKLSLWSNGFWGSWVLCHLPPGSCSLIDVALLIIYLVCEVGTFPN